MLGSGLKGLRLAALYGLVPHCLGFCGPQEKSATCRLLDFLSGRSVSERKIRKILGAFYGAFFYYKIIAKANDIEDPFDERVVKAYWLGSKLLEKVKISDLKKAIIKDFCRPGLLKKKEAARKARGIPINSKPHHSFHVLIIGSVSGRIVLKGKLLDFCRIGWGKVIEKSKIPPSPGLPPLPFRLRPSADEVAFGRRSRRTSKNQKSKIIVRYKPLVKKNNKYILGKAVKKELFWDKRILPKIEKGDWVSIHWNYPIQILSKKDRDNLNKYTLLTIELLNTSSG